MAAQKSQILEPHNAATLNLLQKVKALQEPLRFTPAGNYKVEYTNDQSGEVQTTDLSVERNLNGEFVGKKTDPGAEASALRSVYAGGDRMWAVADTPFGPMEFRIRIKGANFDGYWAGPFGRNGKLTGKKMN